MFVGISTGVTPFTENEGAVIAATYVSRVIADGGYVEGVDCMIYKLEAL
jgi:hypothetical protein